MARERIARRYGLSALSVIAFLVAWDLLAIAAHSAYLPRPYPVLRAFATSWVERDFMGFYIGQHVLASLGRIFYGFGLAAVIAIPLGLLAGWFVPVQQITGPIVELIRPIPPLAWIPFAIYYFREPFDAVFIVFLAVFFPILLSTVGGVKGIDTILIDAARTLGARNLQLFTKVAIPASLPQIMTGARIGLGVGWMSIVAAEMVGVRGGGLGYYIWSMGEVGSFDFVFSGMILIGLVGLAMMGGLQYLERRLAKVWG